MGNIQALAFQSKENPEAFLKKGGRPLESTEMLSDSLLSVKGDLSDFNLEDVVDIMNGLMEREEKLFFDLISKYTPAVILLTKEEAEAVIRKAEHEAGER